MENLSVKGPLFNSIAAVQTALRRGDITCTALIRHYLQQAEAHQALNAYVECWPEEALRAAEQTDRLLREHPERLGPLFGVALSLKDNICFAGHTVTAASKILEGFTSLYSATAVERLQEAGAIFIGRTNCDQFGMGSSNENSVYGPVHHAEAPDRVPGGSSGGAAVSLQIDSCIAALGTDTGGSIRQPAAFCGLWGFKPTYGRISRHGLIAYGSSFDQLGMMAHNPTDIELLLRITEGPDAFDSTVMPAPEARPNTAKARIAYFPETLDSPGMDAGVRAISEDFLERLRQGGHEVAPCAFPLLNYIIPAYYVLTTAEASTNLARFDGIRYGYRSPRAGNLEETYLLSRSEGFSEEVKRRILLGTFVLSSGYYDAYYAKAQQVRRMLRDQLLDIFRDFDFVFMPAAPTVAWRIDEKTDDPVAMYLSDIYTVSANLAGVPAIAIPAGRHPELQLPVGVQLLAAPWADLNLLQFAV